MNDKEGLGRMKEMDLDSMPVGTKRISNEQAQIIDLLDKIHDLQSENNLYRAALEKIRDRRFGGLSDGFGNELRLIAQKALEGKL